MIILYNSLNSNGPITTKRPIRGVKSTFILLNDSKSPSLGIEIIVYTLVYKTRIDKLIYVSKADTTGLFPSSGYVTIVSFLNWLISLSPLDLLNSLTKSKWEHPKLDDYTGRYISHTHFGFHVLLERHRGRKGYYMPVLKKESSQFQLPTNNVRTRLVLFTKPEKQYLFPKSYLNSDKHLLNGESLLRWWINVIDGLEYESKNKFIDIIGANSKDIEKYVKSRNGWCVGSLFNSTSDDVAINCIPLLPDDPKGRFLEHLVVENRIKKVKMNQFWTELSARQEFRIGITVGLLGVEFIENKSNWHSLENSKKLNKKEFINFKNLMMDKEYNKEGDWDTLDVELQEAFGELPTLNFPKPNKSKLQSQNIASISTSVNIINTLKPRSKNKK